MKGLFKYLFSILLFLLIGVGAMAATITSTTTGGSWSTGSSWVGGVAPSTNDNVVIATTGTGKISISSNLTFTGNITVNNGASLQANSSSVTVTLTGNLTVNSGGLVQINRTFTINGNTNISGTIGFASTSGTSRTMTFNGDVTLNSGAIWNEVSTGNGSNNNFVFQGNFVNNSTTFNAVATGNHTFSGTSKSISGSKTTTFSKFVITGSITNSSNLNASTSFTINSGSLTNNGSLTTVNLAGSSGTLTNASTGRVYISGTASGVTLVANATGNYVEYTGSGQTILPTTYYDLYLSGSGTENFTSTIAVNHILDIDVAGSVVVSLASGGTYTAYNLTTNTNGQNAGTYGSSSSTATNKKSYFSSTGILTVSNTNSTNNTNILSKLYITLPGQTFTTGSGNSGSPTSLTAGIPFNIQIRAIDNLYNLITSYSGTKTISYSGPSENGNTNIYTTSVTFNAGVASTVTTTIKTAQTSTIITATDGTYNANSSSFDVNANIANKLAFSTSPDATQTAGASFPTLPVVQVLDAYGNLVSSSASITLSLSSGTGVLSGTKTLSAAGGIADFSTASTALSIDLSGTKVLTASSSGLASATSTSFMVEATSASKLGIITSASGAISGSAFSRQPSIAIQDTYGNTVTTDNSTIVTMTVNTGSTVGTYTKTASNGIATFTNVGISGVIGTYTLTYASSPLTSVSQSIIMNTLGAASQLSITILADGAQSGLAFNTQPVVAIQDASGNTITTDNTSVITLSVNSGSRVGTYTKTVSNGIATFANVGIVGSVGTYTLTYSSSPNSYTATSQQIILDPGVANKLALTTPASGASSGNPFSIQPVITLQDASGNTIVDDYSTIITLTLNTGSTFGSYSKILTAGIANFTDVGIAGTVGVYTVTYGSTPIYTNVTQSISLNAGTASQLVFSTTPSASTVASIPFAQQPVVTIKDAYGNTVNSTASVSISLSAGAGTLGGTTSVNAIAGVATFSGLNINTAGADKVLTASSSGLTPASTSTFTITGGGSFYVTPTTRNATCAALGKITLAVTGGVAPFKYDWADISGNSNIQDRVGITAGTYSVTVTDANGLTTNSGNIIVTGDLSGCTGITVCKSETASVFSADPDPNNTSYNWSITPSSGATITGDGTASIKINWTAVPVGTYQVCVVANNSCGTSTQTCQTVYVKQPEIALFADPTCSGSTLNLHAYGASNYIWAGPNGFTSNSVNPSIYNATSSSANGTYTITATDANGCSANTSNSISFNVTELPSVDASSITPSSDCTDPGNGSITLTTLSGGTSPYTFSWSKVGSSSFSATTRNLNTLSTGSYIATITNKEGCTNTSSFSITSASGPSVSIASTTNISCYGASSGAINITPTQGTNGNNAFSFVWTNSSGTFSSTNQNLTGLSVGKYTVVVKDGLNCSASIDATITQPVAPVSAEGTLTQINCNGASTGAITLNVSGGTPSYTYNWIGPNSFTATTKDISGLRAGNYTVAITDAALCPVYTNSFTITQPSGVLTATATINSINCYNGATGLINLTVAGGTSPYTYSWSKTGSGSFSATTEDLSGLTVGTYSVVITDSKSCTLSPTGFVVSQPVAALSISTSSINNVNCYGGSDAAIAISAAGGTSSYTYSWSNGATSTSLTGLSAGTYTATVTDANGCTNYQGYTITQPSSAILTTISSTISPSCYGNNNGSINLSSTGGTTPYTYSWTKTGSSSYSSTTRNLTGLLAGTYNVIVTDNNGCTSISSTTITQPDALNVSGAITNVSCNGLSTGAINITTSGGSGVYSYNWGGGVTTEDRTALSAGTYSVTITDNNSCSITQNYTITQPSTISLSMTNTNLSCNGSADGSITLTATGGTAPFTYAWTGPNSFTATTKNISNLSPGIYTVTVTDANGCTATLISAAITQPVAITVAASIVGNVNCYNGADGSITALASGGTAPFTYSWSNGSIGAAQSSLAAGIYKVIVVDANGCTAKDSLTITQPSQPIKVYGTVTDTRACAGTPSGKIDVTVENASGTLTYAWTGPTTIGNIQSPTGLAAGDYALTVSNALGCTATLNKTVGTSAILVASVSTVDKTCATNPDGSAYAVATGGVAPYKYAWASGDTTQKIKGLNVGTFTVNVTDANGCQSSASGTVGSPVCDVPIAVPDVYIATNGATISNTISTNDVDSLFTTTDLNYQLLSVPSTEQGTIKANLDGSFVFTPTPLYNGKVQMTYLLTNPLGLSSRTTINIYVAHITITDTVVNSDCTKGGSINLAPSGGFPGYKYSWTGPGNFISTSQNVSALSPGTYQVSITDSVGANVTQTYVITDNCAPGVSSIYLSGTNSFIYNALPQGPQTYTAHGSTGAVTIIYSGNGSNIYESSTSKPTLPGKYKAVATLAADANNASATSVDFEFTIEKAPLTVSAGNQTVYFGDPIASILKAGTYSITGFVGTDNVSVISGTVSYTTNYTTTTNVSATGITITPVVSGLSALNYSFQPVSGIITIKSASTARPLPPTVNNANYIYGSTAIPKKLSSLVVSKPIGAVPAWCNVDSSTCDTVAPAMPILIGKYIYALKSLDTTNGLFSATYTYDTVIIRPNIPTVIDSTYVLGLLTNPANISLQVTGMTGNTINYFINSVKQSVVPKLPAAVGVFRYTASQIVNAIESDTVGFNVTMLNVNDLIHLRKIVDTGVLQSNSTFNYPFTLVVTNLTKYPFTNIIVTDNLHNSVPITSDFSIVKNGANGGLIANPLFNGSNDINVTNNTSTLAPFAKDTAKFVLNLVPKGYNGTLNNIAYVKADTKWGTIMMQSSSETKANETFKSPTTYLVKDLKIYIPEGFSPNHDGVNDKFVIIKPYNITLDFEVFNRWGNVVYKNSNYNNEWDGKGTGNFVGQDLIDGGYYYSLRAVDDKGKVEVFKGFIIIQR